jgi:uncharacterized SAM-binding protein YcdF (DUF218 family)
MKNKFMTKERILLSVLFFGILGVQLLLILVLNHMQVELSEKSVKAVKYGFRLAQVALIFWYGYQTVLKEFWIWIFAFMTIAAPFLNVVAYGILFFRKLKKEQTVSQSEVSPQPEAKQE